MASDYALGRISRAARGGDEIAPTVAFREIDARNPLEIDLKGRAFDEVRADDLPEWLRYLTESGEVKTADVAHALLFNHRDYDGLIVRNVRDSLLDTYPPSTVFVPLQR